MKKLTGPEASRVADLIERAVDLYESEQIEWCQNGFFNQNNSDWSKTYPNEVAAKFATPKIISACAWGSLILAACEHNLARAWELSVNGSRIEDVHWGKVLEAKLAIERNLQSSVPVFNDEVGRTKQEIIDAMKDTAKDLRNA